ncbi:hypothetical protein [Celeribacter marinus]|uniref:hypothetical protein n=1 Tax=Celeribacter marinus TaxID=1397108 RepID=UPI00317FF513
MARKNWHIKVEGDTLTLARRLPARFDFAATAVISGGAALRRGRMARQVRQDMWRALQTLRGFAPAVSVRVVGDDLEVTAGGGVAGAFPKAHCEAIVADVLSDPARRARWIAHATREEADHA